MTLVLLHPLPLDGSIWDNELRALGSPCVAPTLYDLGDTLEEWAGGVLDLCGSGPLVLVGNSVGGSCALEICSAGDRECSAHRFGGVQAGGASGHGVPGSGHAVRAH